EIAAELNLPVIIHCREAFDDVIAILDRFKGSLKGAVIHCYSGNAAEARQYLDMGFHISFTGIVTFKNSIDVQEAAKIVPLDRMMVETDCPYISPVPVRNKRPCEPAFLVHTARKLAELKDIDPEEFAQAVTATSRRFFDLP
ncbi:MAG: TatD family hydrolase, partial [Planctomycetes bacterium]|nr:TatD family hydrolase [Planctomycetota bacterium]